jgi:hypothetical protein
MVKELLFSLRVAEPAKKEWPISLGVHILGQACIKEGGESSKDW